MSLPGPASYRITEADHYAVNKLVLGRSLGRLKLVLLLLLPVVALIVVADVMLGRSILDDLMPIVVGVTVGGIAAMAMFVSLKSRARKVYRETGPLQEEMTLVFEDDGFRVEQPSGLWRVQWQQLVRWDEDRDIFAVFPNRLMTIIFPKAQLSEDVVDFMREQMKQSGLPRPWKLRK